ncbi:MAG: RDD family protein [Gammaproteobacteria bacterium]|nr:RDD family protein [Gammaproteobacteria bacterium]MYF38533.1 RDD family protein [Gammaproteobacteria bacterium]
MSTTFNPYKAPKSDYTEAHSELHQYELATIWQRILARVIDELLLLFTFVVFLVFIGIGAFIVGAFPLFDIWLDDEFTLFTFNLFDLDIWIDIIVLNGLFLMLNGVLLHRYGQTIGKMLLKIKMVDADTHALVPLRRIFVLRYLIWSIPSLFMTGVSIAIGVVDLLFGLRKNRRTLHDLTANTIVIKDSNY